MENRRLFHLSLAITIWITLYLGYLVFKPFLTSIILGAALSILFYPLYLRFLIYTKGRRGLSSFLVCLLSVLILIIPLILLTTALVNEITFTYKRIENIVRTGEYGDIIPFMENPAFIGFYDRVTNYLDRYQMNLKDLFLNTLNQISSYAVQIMTATLKNLALFAANTFFMLFTLYYLLKDSDAVASEIGKLIPLTERHKERIFERLRDIIHATLYGSLASASAQGFLGGMAFWALDISSPVLWGTVMGFLALLPMVGAFLIWLPACLILLLKGSYIKAVILFVWGTLVISTADNIIRPFLMSGKAMLHPLVTFFSILGGILVFGPIGLFAGPFVVALFIILLDMVREVSEPEKIGD